MPELDSVLTDLDGARQNLAEALAQEEWDGANKFLISLRDSLEALGKHLDADSPDEESYNNLVGIYNAAVDQHNAAVDTLNSADQYAGWRIGDTRPCGCPVEPVSVACPPHEQRWGPAQPDCGDCEFGVPGVRHWAYGCEDPK